MKKILKALAMGLIMATLVGCQTAPMTAKSRLEVVKGLEPLTVVEKTTTITTTNGISTTNIVEIATTKSSSAGDLELKKDELEKRKESKVAKENAKGRIASFFDWLFTPDPRWYGGGYYDAYGNWIPTPPTCIPPGRAWGGNIYFP